MIFLIDAYPDTMLHVRPLWRELKDRGHKVSFVIADPFLKENAVYYGPVQSQTDAVPEAQARFDDVMVSFLKADIPLAVRAYSHREDKLYRVFRGLGSGVFNTSLGILADEGFVYGTSGIEDNAPYKVHPVGSLKVQHLSMLRQFELPHRRDLITVALDNTYDVTPILKAFARPGWGRGIPVRLRHHIGSSGNDKRKVSDGLFGTAFWAEVSNTPLEVDIAESRWWLCFSGSTTAIEASVMGSQVGVLPSAGPDIGSWPKVDSPQTLYDFLGSEPSGEPYPESIVLGDVASRIADILEA